jgi:hypothetical protein
VRVLVGLCLMALSGYIVACGPPPLAHTQLSADALGREVLLALAQRNEGRLRELAIDEEEFRQHVWPDLPAARPERNVPFNYVWGDLRQKSDAGLRRTMQAYGGQRYDLRSVKFANESTNYGGYRVHRETVLVVGDGKGMNIELRVLGSMLEKEGRWKVFSYVVDE